LAWTTRLTAGAEKYLSKLDTQVAKRVTRYLRERVLPLPDPRMIGEPLVGNFQGYWRYRVGDYRIVCELQDKELLILVIEVGHRKDVYQ